MLVAVLETTLNDTPHDLIMIIESFLRHWLAVLVDGGCALAFWMEGRGIGGLGEIQDWVVICAMNPIRTTTLHFSRFRIGVRASETTYRSTKRPS